MRIVKRAAAGIAIGALALVGCGGGSKPDVAACEKAMTTQLADQTANPNAAAGTKPAACKGVSDTDLQRIAARAMEGDSPAPAPEPTATTVDDALARAWVTLSYADASGICQKLHADGAVAAAGQFTVLINDNTSNITDVADFVTTKCATIGL